MQKLNLNGTWQMRPLNQGEWIEGNVPGSVFGDLLANELIPDPFYRANEDIVREWSNQDFVYQRIFTVDNDLWASDEIFLTCEGLDTLAEITLNGQLIAKTDNMHRSYEFPVKDNLRQGENTIQVVFRSPLKYIAAKNNETPLWGVGDAIAGYPHIRKTHSMFGWDWGPQLPDAGIWRDIYLVGYNEARLTDVYVTQEHTADQVNLDIRVTVDRKGDIPPQATVKITGPDGETFSTEQEFTSNTHHLQLAIPDPKLWWPNGLGEQPLYTVSIELQNEGRALDKKEFRIGLRTITIEQPEDEWGKGFQFVVNGVPIFIKGANYIPEDSLLGRRTPEKTRLLIESAVDANYNCLRIWGGGHYPEDYFYDLCDEYGLIVWQDFMFACSVYKVDKQFADNVAKEAESNIRRLRHHASLGLWCGNNEIEEAWNSWGLPKDEDRKQDYLTLFEDILPKAVEKFDPNTFYWPSSPSSGGGFDNPNDENHGDVHYWDVWHGLKPFTDYRNHYFRFVSEFGFQSFPGIETVETFTEPEDRNIFSYVMEKHQKNGMANGLILYYLSETFKYPKDFSSLLYVSQLLQASAIQTGVEHWRQNRGRCMGTLYWQINDCWPVASWASIDYYGRWKALHYAAKKFYDPILLSIKEEGKTAAIYLTNDTFTAAKGTIKWALKDQSSKTIAKGSVDVEIPSMSSRQVEYLDLSNHLASVDEQQTRYLEVTFEDESRGIRGTRALFAKSKHFRYLDPKISVRLEESTDAFVLILESEAFADFVEVSIKGYTGRLSDNYFHLSAGEKKQVEISKAGFEALPIEEELESRISVRSIFDSF